MFINKDIYIVVKEETPHKDNKEQKRERERERERRKRKRGWMGEGVVMRSLLYAVQFR